MQGYTKHTREDGSEEWVIDNLEEVLARAAAETPAVSGPQPTEEQILTFQKNAYRQRRAAEYPPIGDQLDALWKGGDEATKMLERILAVKAKYPKPTE